LLAEVGRSLRRSPRNKTKEVRLMRACQWNPSHPIAEDADPRRVWCSNRCRQAAYNSRRVLKLNLLTRFELCARTSPEAARVLAELTSLGAADAARRAV
jgi:hypothetical protein